jgi:hypothetical protein
VGAFGSRVLEKENATGTSSDDNSGSADEEESSSDEEDSAGQCEESSSESDDIKADFRSKAKVRL